MKAGEYCCCAIPLVNAGIYLTLIEHVVASSLIGILAITTPSIVGASTASFASWMLAIVCFGVAALQLLGFIGVVTGKPDQEKTDLYRQYVNLNGLAILAAFSVAATWIITSAIGHSGAQAKCVDDFFSSATSEIEGEPLCNFVTWVDVVIMGALWTLFAILQLYLFFILKSTLPAPGLSVEDMIQKDTEKTTIDQPEQPTT